MKTAGMQPPSISKYSNLFLTKYKLNVFTRQHHKSLIMKYVYKSKQRENYITEYSTI